MTPAIIVSTEADFIVGLLPFVKHKSECSWLGIMDDKGPCDCGLKKMLLSFPLRLHQFLANVNVSAREIYYEHHGISEEHAMRTGLIRTPATVEKEQP